MKRADALAVLRERGSPLTARAVELDQPPVRGLVERIECEPAARVLDRARMAAPRAEALGEAVEHGTELARERARLQRLPVVERRAVAQAEAGEEGSSLQRRGLLEVGEVVSAGQPAEVVDVERHAVPLQGDRIACDGEPAAVERRAERRERPPQRRAGAVGRVFRPQELGERVATVASGLHSEVREQRRRLARVDLQRRAVAERLRRAEERQPQRRVAHESDRRRNGSQGIAFARNDLGTIKPYNMSGMSAWPQSIARVIRRSERSAAPTADDASAPVEPQPQELDVRPIEISPNDPIVAYFQSAPGAVDLEELELDSPALVALREAGVKLAVPLVSQGELVGLLNLGPRLSDQDYSTDDRKLLDSLAAQAAPALQVAQLVRRQETEARSRERIEQELRVATMIQQNYLPRELPKLPGWDVSAYYRPAREVGGDFYDFIELPEGQIGVVIGDVTDKGVPAAMVMAATRSVLRASAQRVVSPGEVLGRVNDLMCPDMPAKMFVTCLYGVLEPSSGRFVFANAGHNLPYVRTGDGSAELRATGMPLGLLPGLAYEETEAQLEPGQTMLLHSDGVAEAHGPTRDMFGFPRLQDVVGARSGRGEVIDRVLTELGRFTGTDWEQEDDITLVALTRYAGAPAASGGAELDISFEVASEPGNEKEVSERVAEAVAPLALPEAQLERLKTAVSEAAMNAIEHGNEARAELPVEVFVRTSGGELVVGVSDRGGSREIPEAEEPDLEAKLDGLQKPRGWGLFLIRNMVDDVRVSGDGDRHTIELVMRLEGGGDEHH